MRNESMTCKNCTCYDSYQREPGQLDFDWTNYGEGRGKCRRYAPRTSDGFPQVREIDWCGEYRGAGLVGD